MREFNKLHGWRHPTKHDRPIVVPLVSVCLPTSLVCEQVLDSRAQASKRLLAGRLGAKQKATKGQENNASEHLSSRRIVVCVSRATHRGRRQ